MITVIRTGDIAQDLQGAVKLSVEMASYIKDTFGVSISVNNPIGSNPFTIGWILKFSDMNAYLEYKDQSARDKKYSVFLEEASKMFDTGSIKDTILSSYAIFD